MKLAIPIVGVLAAALLLAACGRESPYHVPMSKEAYPRWEAPGMFGASTGPRNIYWIDNERVLYVGRDDDDTRFERTTLRVWTPATGKVEEFGPARGELCYFRGFVSYVERVDRTPGLRFVVKEGELGGALETILDSSARHRALESQGFRKHPITCRYYQSNELAPGENCKVPLLPGDGYLEVAGGRCEETNRARIAALNRRGPSDEAARSELSRITTELARRPVMYHAADGGVTALPIEANEFQSSGPRVEYVEWKQRYQFQQLRGKRQPTHGDGVWPTDQPNLVYLFDPSGDLEQEAIPVRENFSKKPDRVAVARAGLVAILLDKTIDRRQGVWGLVLYSNQKPQILDDGMTQEFALSPDGCRVAYTRQVGDGTARNPVHTHVRAIDLCSRAT